MSKQLDRHVAPQNPDESNAIEDPLRAPVLEKDSYATEQALGPTAINDVVQDTKNMSCIAWAVRAVTAPTMFAPEFPTLPIKPSTKTSASESEVEGLREESTGDSLNAGSGCIDKRRWIKHTLTSGLVIEVEATVGSIGLAKSQAEFTGQPPTYSTTVGTRSPEKSDSSMESYDSSIFVYDYLEDWHLNPPRQGGDYFFEQLMDELQADLEPFYRGDPWRQKFLPTLLMFLGTRSNPWDWLGDEFVSLLRKLWSAVYGEPSWSGEDGDLVLSLAIDRVNAWFDSFASHALTAAETFLKRLTDGSPNFSKWSEICKEIMRDGRMFYACPDGPNSSGLFRSIFVLAPLSGHMQEIRHGTWVEGLACSSDDLRYPFGAIGLAAAAAFRAVLLFRAQLITYDEEGNLLIKMPTGYAESPAIDTAFSKETAGGRTKQCALFACNLTPAELRTILSHADEFVLHFNYEVDNSGGE